MALALGVSSLCLFSLGFPATANSAAPDVPDSNRRDLNLISEFIQSNCLDCHTGDDAERGFDLTKFTAILESDEVSQDSTSPWEKALLRIQSRQMPPPDTVAVDESDYVAAQVAMERLLENHAQDHPFAGQTAPLRRMTRTEYKNSIRDLLSIQVDVDSILPPDSSSDGFDNITVAELSPLLIDRYLTAATRISRVISSCSC